MDILWSGRYFGKCEHHECSLYLPLLSSVTDRLFHLSDVLSGEYKGDKVEVKSLKDECKGLEDFLAEASVLTSLSHPNLVKLIGVSVDQKPVYFITEFMEKGPLFVYLQSSDRSVIQKSHQAAFAQDVCSGMAHLEQRDLVHRFVVHCMILYCFAPECTCACKSI